MKELTSPSGYITKIFAETLENEAIGQIQSLINFEAYNDSKVRIMPDCHAGVGCTIGTTMEIKDKVTPNLVGVDIGCGMLTIKIKEKTLSLSKLDKIVNSKIPSGLNVYDDPVEEFDFNDLKCKTHVDIDRAMKSIGTLGGGNHFIEVDRNESGDLFLVIHTGSRNIGNQVAKFYQNIAIKSATSIKTSAKELVRKLKKEGRQKEISRELQKLKRPKVNKDLAYLTGEYLENYLNDMKIIQNFASLNRRTIANRILKYAKLHEVDSFETIHNYIDFKRNILRKGAISAELNEKVLIPMNMRDGSLVCVGKGNADWNYSAPHGAGRLMSRSKARKNIKMETFKKQMRGIFSSSITKETLDEAPNAYKPTAEIIKLIQDTVEIIDIIKPIYNFKAH
jgi:RNA-splicing ligase RtcB